MRRALREAPALGDRAQTSQRHAQSKGIGLAQSNPRQDWMRTCPACEWAFLRGAARTVSVRAAGVTPFAYAVWWKENAYLGMVVHVLLNTVAVITVVALVLQQLLEQPISLARRSQASVASRQRLKGAGGDDGMEERMAEQSRVLLTHAHPDDESCATGGTIAKYVAEGAHVTVVTCTRGEQGNVAGAKLAHLAADQQDLLGDRRSAELRNAAAALGLDDHRYLGGEGRYRDSGRMGAPSNERPDAFWQADLAEVGAQLAAIIREVRPHVIVTYDSNGGYGHPDHIQTHRVAMRAVQLSSDPEAPVRGEPWDVPKVYWCAVPRELIRGELASLKGEESSHKDMWVDTDLSQYPDGVHDDSEITTEIDISRHFEAKRRALGAHHTQLTVRGDVWVLASGRGMRIQNREWFILVKGSTGVGGGDHGREDDLFAGLTDRTRKK